MTFGSCPRAGAPRLLGVACFCAAGLVVAQVTPEPDAQQAAELRRCAAVVDSAERLACFDAVMREEPEAPKATFLERHWDLAGQGGVLRPWPHRPTYVLPGRWTDDVNDEPFAEAGGDAATAPPKVQSIEAKFQVSFKTKLWEGMFGGPGNLWFGYTQQSHFQIYNASESRPFRETDFEPELIAAFPTRRTWGAWSWRMVGVGVAHQSNGRSEPLSRSWNRIYGIVAGERGNLALQLRGWVRFDSTDRQDDDNPEIEEFIGRAEALVNYMAGRHVLGLRFRSNVDPDPHRGSFQADWFYPIGERLRGQVQLFTGYGESLIDFDHRQTALGVGFLLFDPF